ncbi:MULTISPECIES: leader peptide SpeFL [Pasteurellaceae]|uniref:Leader peptide SpeFL n=1 Tax=Pasteurella atlantica TaxID=2827233 RepID=A0AAW8CP56_9PAST|nr:leader peptide SpeFL [Pasteurella atlantica]MDP8041222.1 leader peptide SpeFL [Pasteurella atlantica]MDP8043359.1 leader peptide SpeFL [Pasteurella atlantica]MDP8045445.1 leader peptide SpeFL [Pasteurella atlantica]MDP8061345.1 leader peptide SpeFL [Pasteurella atlantica]
MLIDYKLEYCPDKGRSIMAHIRRTRHIMMPAYRSCFSYYCFQSSYITHLNLLC